MDDVYVVPPSGSADLNLSAAIRRRREALESTQEDTAHAAELTVGTFGRIERGLINPTWTTIKRIARALDTTVAQLASIAEVGRVLGEIPERESVLDPHGRTVHLTPSRWNHILIGHPHLFPYLDDLLRAIQAPTAHIEDARPGQDWFYLRGIGPSAWLKVVVTYDRDTAIGIVKTAFPRRDLP
jgi:transcriptional regulator with XRE-family HTH domain